MRKLLSSVRDFVGRFVEGFRMGWWRAVYMQHRRVFVISRDEREALATISKLFERIEAHEWEFSSTTLEGLSSSTLEKINLPYRNKYSKAQLVEHKRKLRKFIENSK